MATLLLFYVQDIVKFLDDMAENFMIENKGKIHEGPISKSPLKFGTSLKTILDAIASLDWGYESK